MFRIGDYVAHYKESICEMVILERLIWAVQINSIIR